MTLQKERISHIYYMLIFSLQSTVDTSVFPGQGCRILLHFEVAALSISKKGVSGLLPHVSFFVFLGFFLI